MQSGHVDSDSDSDIDNLSAGLMSQRALTIDTQLASQGLGQTGTSGSPGPPAAELVTRAHSYSGVREGQRSLDDSLLGMVSPVSAATFEAFEKYLASLPHRSPNGANTGQHNGGDHRIARGRSASVIHNACDGLASIKNTLDQILIDRQFERKSSTRLPADSSYIRRESQHQRTRTSDNSLLRSRLQRGQTFALGSSGSTPYNLSSSSIHGATTPGGTNHSNRNSLGSMSAFDLDAAMAAAASLAAGHGVNQDSPNLFSGQPATDELRRRKPDRYRSGNDAEQQRLQNAHSTSRNGSQDLSMLIAGGVDGAMDEYRRPSLTGLFTQDNEIHRTPHDIRSPIGPAHESQSDTDGYASAMHAADQYSLNSYEEGQYSGSTSASLYNTSGTHSLAVGNSQQSSKNERPRVFHRHGSSGGNEMINNQGGVPSVTNAPMSLVTLPPPVAPTVADIAPLASMSGFLTTFYRNNNMLFNLRPWKTRYYLLSGHVLYRFKGCELDSTVTDMMKLTPTSVVCVSDQFPGKQYCIEIAGAVSPVVPVNSSSGGGMNSSHSLATHNVGMIANPAPTVWEAKRWYVQATNATELGQWLSKLKAAVVRAKYATRALPNPPSNASHPGFVGGQGAGRPIMLPSTLHSPTGRTGRSMTSSTDPTATPNTSDTSPVRRASATATVPVNEGGGSARAAKARSMMVSTGTLRIGVPMPPPPPPLPSAPAVPVGYSRRPRGFTSPAHTPADEYAPGTPSQRQSARDGYFDGAEFGGHLSPGSDVPFRRAYSDQSHLNQQQHHPSHSVSHGGRGVEPADARAMHASRRPPTSAPGYGGVAGYGYASGSGSAGVAGYGYASGSGSAGAGSVASNPSSASSASSPTSGGGTGGANTQGYDRRGSLAPVREDR